jgi:transcriptional repressor NrdR
MRCPYCQHSESKVIDSRDAQDGEVIRRRRECLNCGRRFTTRERIEEVLPLIVKKDGRREAFDREKLISGLKKACQKRPVSMDAMERIVAEVERELQDSGEKEVPASFIGERVMAALKNLDPVAYVRFASVYRSFRDVNEFMDELKGLLSHRGEKPSGS